MKTAISKKIFSVGSKKNGFMFIQLNETVNIVKETEKQYYIEKNGLIKSFYKKDFDINQ